MIRIEDLDLAHEEAIQYILKSRNDKDIGNFTNWLMETQANYYDIFSDHWRSFNSSIDVECFLKVVYHALVDDGDVCFPVINGVPKLIFSDRYETTPEVIKLMFRDVDVSKMKLEFLDNIDEFIEQAELYHVNTIKQCYLCDLELHGEEMANSHYSKYKCYSQEWKNDEVTDEKYKIEMEINKFKRSKK